METIITSATVLGLFLNLSTTATGKYCCNADMENGKMNRMEILNKDGKYLSLKLQYRFAYDGQKRLASKEALKFNTLKQAWEQHHMQVDRHTDNGYSIEKYNWNAATNAYDKSAGKTEYPPPCRAGGGREPVCPRISRCGRRFGMVVVAWFDL